MQVFFEKTQWIYFTRDDGCTRYIFYHWDKYYECG